jgi:superfamily II DNA helicase RecQ
MTVERKSSLAQVVERMVKILDDFYEQHQGRGTAPDRPRSICYCLTPRRCKLTVEAFLALGIKADVFDGKQTDSEHKNVLERFHGGKIQVICATKALGRGVNLEKPIRFIFHSVMPISLSGAY